MGEEEPKVLAEFRVGWSINMVGGSGFTDWWPAEPGETEEEARTAVEAGSAAGVPMGFEAALEDSGFDWWVETREVAS